MKISYSANDVILPQKHPKPRNEKAATPCLKGYGLSYMAVRQGFEPWEGYEPSTVFKTVAFDHSATSPASEANNTATH